MGYLRRDLRGLTWADYHYICKGYMMRLAREQANFRNVASVWGGRKVFDSWKIPELDKARAESLPDMTEEEKRIANKIWQSQRGI